MRGSAILLRGVRVSGYQIITRECKKTALDDKLSGNVGRATFQRSCMSRHRIKEYSKRRPPVCLRRFTHAPRWTSEMNFVPSFTSYIPLNFDIENIDNFGIIWLSYNYGSSEREGTVVNAYFSSQICGERLLFSDVIILYTETNAALGDNAHYPYVETVRRYIHLTPCAVYLSRLPFVKYAYFIC